MSVNIKVSNDLQDVSTNLFQNNDLIRISGVSKNKGGETINFAKNEGAYQVVTTKTFEINKSQCIVEIMADSGTASTASSRLDSVSFNGTTEILYNQRLGNVSRRYIKVTNITSGILSVTLTPVASWTLDYMYVFY